MATIQEVYTTTIHKNLKPFFANWEPGRPVELGDYGLIEGYSFTFLGNVKDMNIMFESRVNTRSDRKTFTSDSSTEVNMHAKSDKYLKATLEINFKSADAVFFNASECLYSMIADKPALGRSIMELHTRGNCNYSWAIITDVIKAGATTVAISSGASSSLVLEASETEEINLADASAKLAVVSQKNVGFQVVGQAGLTPLIGLCKIQKPWIFGKEFNPFSLSRTDQEILDEPVREGAIDQFFFAELQDTQL